MPVKPRVWFERSPSADLTPLVEEMVTIVGGDLDGEERLAAVADADGALAGGRVYDDAFFDRSSRLKVICRTGIGFDKVDVAAATRRNIAVCNTPDGPTISTAEHAIALMLAAAKQIKLAEARLRRGESDLYARHRAIELDGTTLGLVGFGRIARRVAAAARGLGMTVAAHDPFLDDEDFVGVQRIDELDELLALADVVSVHIPLVEANAGLFDADRFGAMRPGAVFVNTARGGLVDQHALIHALDSGRLSAAGLDVTDPEPLPPDHPLLHRDDVIVTPHIASGTVAGRQRIFRMAFDQVVDALTGRRPPHLLNPEVWDAVSRRIAEDLG